MEKLARIKEPNRMARYSVCVCVCVCVCVLVAQVCPTLGDPMDCSRLGSSVHRIFQARILERVAISFSNRYIHIHISEY